MGRPRKQEGETRERILQVRLQDAEYDQFKEAAESCGLDLSAWVRTKLIQQARKDLREAEQSK